MLAVAAGYLLKRAFPPQIAYSEEIPPMTMLCRNLPCKTWLCSFLAFFGFAQVSITLSTLWADEANLPPVSYSQQIEPIFRANCQGCHQPAKAHGDFVMTDASHLFHAGESGEVAVVPGKPEESYLLDQVAIVDGMAAMPKNAPALGTSEIDLIRRWIAEGAINDAPPAAPVHSAQNPPGYTRPPLITSLVYSPNGKWLAVSGFHEVLLVDAASNQTKHRLIGLSERIESLSFSPDSTRLAVTGGSPGRLGEVQVWDCDSAELLLSKQVTYDTIYGGCFSPDGKLIAFGCSDNTVRAIDAETGEFRLHQGAHDDWIQACVFSPDGKHLVSAGRDMTVKLTEVETERFVDNITSITPGALRGGISSLVMHPQRNETLVGGSDGIPKIYRLFRETERRIGDDANLIRSFPAMPGRIFSLSIDSHGKHFAAASTLDGNSRVVVYSYDFDGTLPDDVKAAMAKRVTDRSEAESKAIADYTSQTSPPVASLDIEGNSIYAIAFSPDGQKLAFGGSDGLIRIANLTEQGMHVEQEYAAVPLNESGADTGVSTALSAGRGIREKTSDLPDAAAEMALLPDSQFVDFSVEPQAIRLGSMRDYAQVVVTAAFADGQQVDVTRQVTFSGTKIVAVSAQGAVRPQAEGQDELLVSWKGQQHRIPVTVGDLTVRKDVDFIRDVNPLLSRLGCNAGTCHGAQKGKNGFKLSLRGYDPLEDVRALSDDLSSRRLNTAAPDASLMLLKPVGAVPHEGGVLLTTDSVYYETLRSWIAEGASLDTSSTKVSRIELYPPKPVVEREGAWQQFRVTAYYADGSSRDVTHEAFVETGNGEVCKSFPGGRVQAVRRGEAPILARYEGAYAAATVTVMGDREGFVWQPPQTFSTVDQLVAAKWERMKIQPSPVCNDSEFLRRVRLDLTGLPPSADELREFLADPKPTQVKRREKIDQLIGSNDYIDHWTNKWSDLLQVNSKFIGSEGAKQFRDWIREAVETNRPYDQFARDILTASGSNKDNPPASYFKILRDPDLMMENTTHLFLAIRFNCNKCHDHPFERWTQDQYYELSAFFAQTSLKADPASGDKKIGGTAVEGAKPLYEEVVDKNDGEMLHVRTGKVVPPAFPYDCKFEVDENATRREQLAAWLTSKDNPYFAKSFVNRLWGYLTGVGLMTPLDDIRAGNPPTNPELLEHLSQEFIRTGFDVEHVMRLICNSRTYQLSIGTNKWNEDDAINYSHATARRLPAEVLYDTVYAVTGAVSAIPGVAPGTRAAALPDVAVSLPDGFLNNLGRPVRESACECERSQELQLGPIMALVSGPTVGSAISDPKCALPGLARGEMSEADMVREIYLRVLSREASDEEVKSILSAADQISDDHRELKERLQARESWWIGERESREQKRLQRLAETRQAITAREMEISADRQRMEQQRLERLAKAQQELDEYTAQAVGTAAAFLDQERGQSNWFPLSPSKLQASNKADLVVQADRSIVASGNTDKGTYTLQFRTPLRGIRGFRLEALPHPGIPGNGPGLPNNGNFVITEIELDAAPLESPKKKQRVTIEKGQADFSQDGFAAEQVFDSQTRDQRGWAVSPRGGTVHWAVFQTKQPIDFPNGTLLTFTIHQNHNAADHRLAHFRLSVTTDEGDLELGLPEDFTALKTLPAAQRSQETLASLLAYVEQSDDKWNGLKSAVAEAKKPLPDDEKLTQLQSLAKSLEIETTDDPQLVQLRSDVVASQAQLENRRLTLAQDLTWALINSPAFLFNH